MTIYSSSLRMANGEPRPHDAAKQARRHAPHEPRTPYAIHPSLRSPFTSFVIRKQTKHHLLRNHFFYDAPAVSDSSLACSYFPYSLLSYRPCYLCFLQGEHVEG
ncbi:unnamed protein product [Ectocarpus sp. 12 AP-2014]